MLKKVLLGTENPSKLLELRRFFTLVGVDTCAPRELGISSSCPEDAKTPEGNAIQKALAWQAAAGIPAFGLDSGLLFLDLPPDHPDQPGTHVRRAGGKNMTDAEMLEYYQALAHKHGGQLRAAWQNAVCLAAAPEHYLTHVESRELLEQSAFLLVDKPCASRHDGWPLDSLSVNIATGRYYMDEEPARFESERLSHWAKSVVDWLSNVIQEF